MIAPDKLPIGTKVSIKTRNQILAYGDWEDRGCGITESMLNHCGKEAVVIGADSTYSDEFGFCYHLDLTQTAWVWQAWMLNLPKEIEFPFGTLDDE